MVVYAVGAGEEDYGFLNGGGGGSGGEGAAEEGEEGGEALFGGC